MTSNFSWTFWLYLGFSGSGWFVRVHLVISGSFGKFVIYEQHTVAYLKVLLGMASTEAKFKNTMSNPRFWYWVQIKHLLIKVKADILALTTYSTIPNNCVVTFIFFAKKDRTTCSY